ncbi:MAG TPA: tetratricopeptide repeat protein, partial [Gemmatales bacterium]|nr:tetratricopeptide repeat protein [Gemmatales bacterium]
MKRNLLLSACCFLITAVTVALWYDLRQGEKAQESTPNVSQEGQQEQLKMAEKKARQASIALDRRSFAKAERLLLEAQAALAQVRGENHESYAWVMKLLGRVYLWTDRYEQAEQAIKAALEIYAAILGQEHPKAIDALNDLGGYYVQKGEWTKARPTLERVCVIYKKYLGEDHILYAASLNNLGWLEIRTEQFEKAEPLVRHAISIYRKSVGEQSPLTA